MNITTACACTAVAFVIAAGLGSVSQEPKHLDRNPALIRAIRNKDAAGVKRLLDAGADPNCREVRISKPSVAENSEGGKPYPGDTALIIAISQNDILLVRLLIVHGADINKAGLYGGTPLMEATHLRDMTAAKMLLDRGAKPNARDEVGNTALDYAANGDNLKLVTLLLEHGANVNGGTGTPPLTVAASNGQVDMVRLLVRKGADVNLRRGGRSPLEAAQNQAGTHEALEPEVARIIKEAGGKARPASVLAEESQRSLKKWRAAERSAQPAPRGTKLTDEDVELLNAVLTDLADYRGKDLVFENSGSQIVLIDATMAGLAWTGENQLNAELDESKANDVTLGMRKDLVQRNVVAASLKEFRPSDPRIVIKSEKEGRTGGFLSKADPKVKLWVDVNLPGYSKAHDRAVVRFSFGPTPHGASGTYFLVKRDGKWHIEWRDFAFYV